MMFASCLMVVAVRMSTAFGTERRYSALTDHCCRSDVTKPKPRLISSEGRGVLTVSAEGCIPSLNSLHHTLYLRTIGASYRLDQLNPTPGKEHLGAASARTCR